MLRTLRKQLFGSRVKSAFLLRCLSTRVEYPMLIDNILCGAEDRGTLDVINPHTGKPFAKIPQGTQRDVERAVTAAKSCHLKGTWGHPENVESRAEILKRIAQQVRLRRDEFAELESRDCGKPLRESKADIDFCADLLDYYAQIAPEFMREENLDVVSDFRAKERKEPVGVVGCVTPWNFPLMQAVIKVAPALAVGCSLILKPSPLASLTCLRFGELCMNAGIPAGALNVISGGPPNGNTGEYLIQNPLLDKLSFTGSGPTGKHLLHASAEKLRPTTLELGGKGAMIVFEDADQDSVMDWALLGIYLCSGQVCSATSRLLIHESIAKDFTESLVEAAKKICVGDPFRSETQMGPVISQSQHQKILSAINQARLDGARVLCGGGIPNSTELQNGFYIQPTIFTDVSEESALFRQEIFGPVLAIKTFRTEEEAITTANNSHYGLAHAVMSSDQSRCERVAQRLDAGVIWQNCSQPLFPSTAFGGRKESGFGKELSRHGLDEYLSRKTIIGTKSPSFNWGWYK